MPDTEPNVLTGRIITVAMALRVGDELEPMADWGDFRSQPISWIERPRSGVIRLGLTNSARTLRSTDMVAIWRECP